MLALRRGSSVPLPHSWPTTARLYASALESHIEGQRLGLACSERSVERNYHLGSSTADSVSSPFIRVDVLNKKGRVCRRTGSSLEPHCTSVLA
jgi:hypothetical protein